MSGRVFNPNWRGLPESRQLLDGTDPDCSFGLGGTCITVAWPTDAGTYFRRAVPPTTQPPTATWLGSLAANGATGSGRLHRRFREYDPATGQFTPEDPLGLAGGANLYGFANGDPVNFDDPFGLCPEEDRRCRSLMDQINRAIAAAFTSLALKTVEIAGGLVNAVTGLGDLYTAAGLNPTQQTRTGRVAAGATFVGGLSDPSPALLRGIRRAIDRAQGATVTFDRLGKFTRGIWEVAGDKGAGYVRWNRILDAEGSTVRLYKDVYDQGGNFLRRDCYVGCPR